MSTVEPIIKDPPRKGQPLYKGHFPDLQMCTCNTLFNFRKEDSLPTCTRDKMMVPKCPLLIGSTVVRSKAGMCLFYITNNLSSICSLVFAIISSLSTANAGNPMIVNNPASISLELDSLGNRDNSLALHWAT